MLGGIMKLTLSLSVLCLLFAFIWQASIVDALPALSTDAELVQSNDDASTLFASNSHTGANLIKRSLHSTVNQPTLLINRLAFLSAPKSHLEKLSHSKSSSTLFQSTGFNKANLRAAKRMKAMVDNRLKRFRMLDQDEFQEMLKSLSQQTAEEQSKSSDGMDALGGMQLANYWAPN